MIYSFINKCSLYHYYSFYVAQAASFSSMSEVWSRWSPQAERSRLVSFSFTGVYVGLTVSYPVSGFVASIWGWRAIFYTTGGTALLWSLLWLLLVRNDPAKDKNLTVAERVLLEQRVLRNDIRGKVISLMVLISIN